MNLEDSDAFTSPAVEAGQVERNYELRELPCVNRVQLEPDYPSGNWNGTGIPFPVNRNWNFF